MARSGTSLGAHLVEEEESYFVSMTDMLVGIIFVFIILLMAFALNFREAEDVRESKVEQLAAADQAKREILEDIARLLEKEGIHVEIDIENGVLHLPEEILFPSGSATLNSQGRAALGHLAGALFLVVPCYTNSRAVVASGCAGRSTAKLDAIFVEGHTDNVPVRADNRFEDNWDLSAQRAIETYKQLISIESRLDDLQVDGQSRQQKLFSVAGYGEYRPRADNTTPEGRQANRRIDLRFLMKTPRPVDLEVVEEQLSEVIGIDEP